MLANIIRVDGIETKSVTVSSMAGEQNSKLNLGMSFIEDLNKTLIYDKAWADSISPHACTNTELCDLSEEHSEIVRLWPVLPIFNQPVK